MSQPPIIINRRYQLTGKLGQGGMGSVYKATDRLNGETVALKRVITPTEDLLFASRKDDTTDLRLALTAEFRTLASLRHPHIISVLDYGFHEKQPFFTMEYLSEAQTLLDAGKEQTLEVKINLIVQVLEALAYLHRRGILHRDLKPANLLVVDDKVKVLDFGLAVSTDTSAISHEVEGLAGTLAYMAPELFIGGSVTRASDIYAVGVLLYELLVGQHPFDMQNVGMMVAAIMTRPVVVDAPGLNQALTQLLTQMLDKNPSHRPRDARALIHALVAATDMLPIPETLEIRDSFIRSAMFVGRDYELNSLVDAIDGLENGHGSAWLVAGESGVGKSRLLDEFRARALVKGIPVLRGQATSEAGEAYRLWRPVLQWLILLADLTPDEAAVFKPLVANIEALMLRTINDAPALDPESEQKRLIRTIGEILSRLNQPLVILLEDIHWAESESLAILNSLQMMLPKVPVMLAATFRYDESPELATAFTGMQLITLKRLEENEIRRLCRAILGDNGRKPHIVQFLARETEGNAFFIVEVIRALAEMAGQLDKITSEELPETILPGGVEQIIIRRLGKIPQEARAVLEYAALIGRQLDIPLLDALLNEVDFDQWLTTCTNAALFDVQDNRWRFSHDHIRTAVIGTIAPEKRRIIHHRIGTTLEAMNPHDTAALAHHFKEAGIFEKGVPYAIAAGKTAYATFANDTAKAHYESALTHLALLPQEPQWLMLIAQAEEALADVLAQTGKGDDALRLYTSALDHIGVTERISAARLQRKLGDTYILPNYRNVSDAAQAYEHAENLLMGAVEQQSMPGWIDEYITLRLAQLWVFYLSSDEARMNSMIMDLQPHVEAQGTPAQRSLFYDRLVLADLRKYRYFNLPNQTVIHARAELDAARMLGESRILGRALFVSGFVHLWRDELDEAESAYQEAIPLAERLGDSELLVLGNTYMTIIQRKRGDVERAHTWASRSHSICEGVGSDWYLSRALANMAWVHWRTGHWSDVERFGRQAYESWKRSSVVNPIGWLELGPLLAVAVYQGNTLGAVEYAKELLHPTQQQMPEEITSLIQMGVAAFEAKQPDQAHNFLLDAIRESQKTSMGYF